MESQKERRLFAFEIRLAELLATAMRFYVRFIFFLGIKGLTTALIFFFLRFTGHLTVSPTFDSTCFKSKI